MQPEKQIWLFGSATMGSNLIPMANCASDVDPSATAPTGKTVQYLETLCDRAIWSDGWKAVARHQRGTRLSREISCATVTTYLTVSRLRLA